jgi:hypothetical protein
MMPVKAGRIAAPPVGRSRFRSLPTLLGMTLARGKPVMGQFLGIVHDGAFWRHAALDPNKKRDEPSASTPEPSRICLGKSPLGCYEAMHSL